MFKLPEEFRIDEKVAEKNERRFAQYNISIKKLAQEANTKGGGYFFFPRVGKKEGAFFLVRAAIVDGWRHIAVSIPTEGRPVTREEIFYIKSMFWSDEEIVADFISSGPYISTAGWVHLWQPEVNWMQMPPFTDKLPKQPIITQFKRFWIELHSEVVKRVKWLQKKYWVNLLKKK